MIGRLLLVVLATHPFQAPAEPPSAAIDAELARFDSGQVRSDAPSPIGTTWEPQYRALARLPAEDGSPPSLTSEAATRAILNDAARSFRDLEKHKQWVMLSGEFARANDQGEIVAELRDLFQELVRLEHGPFTPVNEPGGGEKPPPDATYRNASASTEERVRDLLARMTLREKAAQLTGVWGKRLVDDKRFFRAQAEPFLQFGVGQITRVSAQPNFTPSQAAALTRAIQDFLRNETRLGIPAIIHEECLCGFTSQGGSIFPQSIGLAATWDPELARAIADTIRGQMRRVGATQGLAPVLDVLRDPRWGRVEETYGEDPYLVSAMGTSYVSGLQGKDLRHGVIATPKHFVAHGAPEGGRNVGSVRVGERELRDVHLLPFEAAIKLGGARSIMNAYHERDGVPVAADHELLTVILRDQLGFKGFVVSDYDSIRRLVDRHGVAASPLIAGIMAIEAGIDVELPNQSCFGTVLTKAVSHGAVKMAAIDTAVGRSLAAKFDLGLFDTDAWTATDVPDLLDGELERALALRAAEASIVLLKNDGILPLADPVSRVAVVGPGAAEPMSLLGDYSYPPHVAKSHTTPITTVLEGIRAAAPPGTEVTHAQGCAVTGDDTNGIDEATALAAAAELCVVVLTERGPSRRQDLSGENHDRASLAPPPAQARLLEELLELDTPVVVVLLSGRPLAFPTLGERCAAIVQAWYPGEEGGAAVASVLFGSAEPGGRLPISFPRSVGHIPVHYSRRPGSFASYRNAGTDPVEEEASAPWYAFGHGLGYTEFDYSDLRIGPEAPTTTDSLEVSVTVRNTGKRRGTEVVQLYVRDPIATVARPVLQLVGFARVELAPDEASRVHFTLHPDQLAFHDLRLRRVVEPGVLGIRVGHASDDIRLEGVTELQGPVFQIDDARKLFSDVRVEAER